MPYQNLAIYFSFCLCIFSPLCFRYRLPKKCVENQKPFLFFVFIFFIMKLIIIIFLPKDWPKLQRFIANWLLFLLLLQFNANVSLLLTVPQHFQIPKCKIQKRIWLLKRCWKNTFCRETHSHSLWDGTRPKNTVLTGFLQFHN